MKQNVIKVGHEAAKLIVSLGNDAISRRDEFTLALTGGHTPKIVFDLLSSNSYSHLLDWSKVSIFWVDERCVEPSHSDSNFLLVQQRLLDRLPIGHYFRMKGELENPEIAAVEYREILNRRFKIKSKNLPRFDVMLLGLGEDGHVASIFPRSDTLFERDRSVVACYVQHLKMYRITMTIPVINNSRTCIFIVSGENKRNILNRVWKDDTSSTMLPVQYVKPKNGNLIWIVDEAALFDKGIL